MYNNYNTRILNNSLVLQATASVWFYIRKGQHYFLTQHWQTQEINLKSFFD